MLISRRAMMVLSALSPIAACGLRITYEDVSSKPQYKAIVGNTYKVVGMVEAYGIREHSKAAVDYVVFQPPPGFKGSEVGFRITIKEGSVFKVRKVLLTNRVFDPPLTLDVEYLGDDLPPDLPVLIDLMLGNEGEAELSLNPKIYQKVVISKRE